MDVFLLIAVIVLTALIVLLNIYIVVYYSHAKDTAFGSSNILKTICVALFSLSIGIDLPLDISNSRGVKPQDQVLPMNILIIINYFAVALFIFVVLPLCIFSYEADDDESTLCQRTSKGLTFSFVFLLVVAGLVGVTYIFLNTASLPYQKIACEASQLISEGTIFVADCKVTSSFLSVSVSLPVYFIGFLALLGWLLLAVYGGIGLISLPMDFIIEYADRPRKLTKQELERLTPKLLANATELLRDGEELKKKYTTEAKNKKRSLATLAEIDKFEEADVKKAELGCKYNTKVEPLFYIAKLVLGVLLLGLTILYIAHMFVFLANSGNNHICSLLYMVLTDANGNPKALVMNAILLWLDSGPGRIVAIVVFTIFALYLMWAAMKGNLKVGMRLLFFKFYTLKPNETYMNALLANVLMANLWGVAVAQFTSMAFEDYLRMTALENIFAIQISHLKFFEVLLRYPVFYTIMGLAIAAGIALTIKKRFFKSARKRGNEPLGERLI